MGGFNRRTLMVSAGAMVLAGQKAFATAAIEGLKPPVARVAPVTETLHGVSLTDPYRWMEAQSETEWKPYVMGQAAYARHVLDAIPGRDALQKEVSALSGGITLVSSIQTGGRYIFIQMRPPGANTLKLHVREGVEGKDRLLVDPDRFVTAGGAHYSLDYWAASPDGRHVVYGVSPAGSEDSTLRVLETATGRDLAEVIDRTPQASPQWAPDGSGFFYNRLNPAAKKGTENYFKNTQAWFHKLGGDPATDVKVLSRGGDPAVAVQEIDFPVVVTATGSANAIGLLATGVQNEQTLYAAPVAAIQAGPPKWTPVCTPADQVTNFAVQGEALYLLSHKGAPRFKVLKTSAASPALASAAVAVPESAMVVTNVAAARDALYVQSLDAGLGNLRRLTPDGTLQTVALPFKGSIAALYTDGAQDGCWFALQSWVRPTVICRVGADGAVVQTALAPKPPIDVTPYDSVEVMARARDGVRVPLSITFKRGIKRDGSAPVLMDAYGAYGVTEDPYFGPRNIAFLERGGVIATAHVRGGGELGQDWRLAGQKAAKPNTWLDVIDCAEYLIAEKWSSRGKIAIQGGSAGGITMGRALTERPDLFCAVIDQVGCSNTTRMEFSQNGPDNIPEFGSVTDRAGFKALLEMDSYQHVKAGTRYPAVMLTTGLTDPRVAPWQATKMTARLQAANASANPIILRVEVDAGHGIGSTRTQRDAEVADTFAFILWRAGHPAFQPKPA